MGLIKSDSAPAPKLAAFSMADIERHAKAILLRARAKADQVLQEAQIAGEEIRRRAHEEGMAAGHEEGVAKGVQDGAKSGHEQALSEHREQMTAAVNALNDATAALTTQRQAMEAAALNDVIGLSVKIAARVTKRQGAVDPAVVTQNVAEALKLVTSAHDVRIAIHPNQRAVLDVAMPRLQLAFPQLKHFELVEDPTVSPGGCRVFTRQGQIDADLDVQLDRIASELVPETNQATPPN